jgi:hypothetical protein
MSEVSLFDASNPLISASNSMLLIDCGMSFRAKVWETSIKAFNILAGDIGVVNSWEKLVIPVQCPSQKFFVVGANWKYDKHNLKKNKCSSTLTLEIQQLEF